MKTARTAILVLAALVAILPFADVPALAAPAAKKVNLQVTPKGFVPDRIVAKAGVPLILKVTRKTAKTCATEIVIKELGINQPLPLHQPVEIRLTPTKPGTLRYACAMGHVTGEIVVK